jgi:hypothetical protein
MVAVCQGLPRQIITLADKRFVVCLLHLHIIA